MQPLAPDARQEAAIRRILSEPTGGAILGASGGTGKTLMVTEAFLRSWANRVLIIGPLSAFGIVDEYAGIYDQWAGTVFRQSGGSIRLRRCSKRNKAESANLQALLDGEEGWFFIGRELFARLDWSTEPDPKRPGKKRKVWHHIWKGLHFDAVVYDECQFAVNKTANGRKSWTDITARLKIASSADWFGNQLLNMHGSAYAVWPDIIPASQLVWADQWLESEFYPFTYNKKRYTVEKAEGAFAKSLPCYIPMESTLGDFPVPEVRWVDLSPKQRRVYDQIEKEGVAWIQDNPLVIEWPVTLYARLRQISLGEVMVSEDGEVDFPLDGVSTKLDEAKAIMADHPGRQFVLVTDSQKFARVVAHRLGIPEWSGAVPQATRDRIKTDFMAGKVQHFVGVIKAMGEAIDGLQHASHDMIFFSEDDSEMMNRQTIWRLHRRGQQHPVNVWIIAARESLDHGQRSRLIETALRNNAAKLLAKNEQPQ